ncbi:protein kinase [Roseimicrobium sp. ORNL1]|uniref:protein kinase domain-containing protein n=1 Tax=Roseimicrobium sp. ORNL1 TaxID=2711231 RepID=UPI0013E17F90|nr:protein kinase [Roseimicrobium sp. ORNL1]QIF05822.1 protein kinase [Roseimicrobium sp. ORNL1]
MNPLDDTLKIDPITPREIPPAGNANVSILDTDLDLQQTVRMPGAGTLVFNRYRLQRVLGRGGMGVVWLAVDTKLERAVALKFLPDAVGIDPVALKELKEETRRGLDLAHPNIVRFYDFVDDDDGAAAISMEFVDGKSLSERRISLPHHIFTVDQLGPWVGQMCDALDYAHLQKRIVHRDLKPANLMVNSESQMKISDFGISCSLSDTMSRLSRANQHSGTSGTLLYMSPQQAMGDRPNPTDDIYAVGATLYELLTGKPPFYRGDITTQITGKIAPKLKDRREELGIPASDNIPREWEEAIAACLEKDPARRPQSAGELAQMLGVSLRSEMKPLTPQVKTNSEGLRPIEISSPPTEKQAMAATTASMTRWIATACGVLLLLACISGGYWWWTNRPGEWAVQTEPAGATITIGTRVFKAPAVITGLPPGENRATVSKEGFATRMVAVTVLPGKRAESGLVSMVRSVGKLTVSSDPDEVDFVVRSLTNENQPKESGVTPKVLNLPVGKYEVTMEHDKVIKITNVEVLEGETPRAFSEFEKPAPVPPPAPTPAPAPVVTANTSPPASAPPSMPSSADMPPAESSATPSGSAPPAPGPDSTANSIPPSPPASAPSTSMPSSAGTPPTAAPTTGANAGAPAPAPAPGATPTAASSASFDPSAPPPAQNPAVAGPSAPGEAAPAGTQPTVGEPAEGHWKLDELFSSSAYNGYSEAGRRYLLYKAQLGLKIGADGKVGPGTHKAIQKFQTANSLQPTGQLDGPTLSALELTNVPDKSEWSAPKSSGGSSSRSNGGRTPESEKTAARKFIERNILGGRDLKEVFKGSKQ